MRQDAVSASGKALPSDDHKDRKSVSVECRAGRWAVREDFPVK